MVTSIDILTAYECMFNMINSSAYGHYQLSDMNNIMFFLHDIFNIINTVVSAGEADFINGVLKIVHEQEESLKNETHN